jgi:hypothetical protein
MNNTMGKLILLLPQKTNDLEYTEINFIPEDTDFIQDHKTFEDRRQQLISEYEKKLRIFKNNSMQMI